MANIADTAQIVQDLYFQNYRKSEDFFREAHFRYLCGVAYSKIVEDEYKMARREAFQEFGFTEVALSTEWLIDEQVEVKKVQDQHNMWKAKLKHPLFVFPYDQASNGIQIIRNMNFSMLCKEFIRESARRKWALCDMPVTNNVYWYPEGKELVFVNAKCGLDKAKLQVSYISDPADESFGDNGGVIPKTKEDLIIRTTLDLMIKAKNGVVVDMTNNANPNKRIQSEIDTVFQDDLRTKPIQ